MLHGIFFGVGFLPGKGARALNKFHVDRDFDLEDIHPVALLGKFRHAASDDFRFLPGKLQRFFVATRRIVAHKLQEEWNIVGPAFVAYAFHEGMLFLVDFFFVQWRVIDEDLHAVGSSFFQPAHRPLIQQVGDAARPGIVVARLLIGQQ